MSNKTATERPYLSIGEVLGLLLEEFPDITISKIRFLESQGLIVPERTTSGYRKFYDDDVDRLRYILREQKEKFLPLRVIKDRLDTPPEGLQRDTPRGIKNVVVEPVSPAKPDPPSKSHPASRAVKVAPAIVDKAPKRPAPPDPSDAVGRPATYSRDEVLALSGLSEAGLGELESFGLVAGHGGQGLFDEHDLAIAEVARAFTETGIDIRHLKAWKTSAEREAGLFEQRVLPVLRRRSPESRDESNELLDEMSDLGARLRAILVARALGPLRDSR
ncbi:MAG: MerR family transcriptional regulator [Acidimicrobiia bacterium]